MCSTFIPLFRSPAWHPVPQRSPPALTLSLLPYQSGRLSAPVTEVLAQAVPAGTCICLLCARHCFKCLIYVCVCLYTQTPARIWVWMYLIFRRTLCPWNCYRPQVTNWTNLHKVRGPLSVRARFKPRRFGFRIPAVDNDPALPVGEELYDLITSALWFQSPWVSVVFQVGVPHDCRWQVGLSCFFVHL